MISLDEGTLAVRLARAALARALGAGGMPTSGLPAVFRERRGVFVTWYAPPGRRLRGCVGFPQPVLPLAEGIAEAAVAAGIDDPRFPPVRAAELASLRVELSLLTPYEPLELAERPRAVRVGQDGLAVESGRYRGLLLPQVAPEQGWTAVEFLDGACEKTGLALGAWRRPEVAVYRFQAEIFRERTPGGAVERGGA